MKKLSKQTIAIVLALLLATSLFSAFGAITEKVYKTSDGTLYWKLTNQTFVTMYNLFADTTDFSDIKIGKYNETKGFSVELSDSCKMTVYNTSKGYIRKITIKLSDLSYADEYDSFSNAIVLTMIVLSEADEDFANSFIKHFYTLADAVSNLDKSAKTFSKSFVINKIKFNFSGSAKNDELVFTITPTNSKNTKLPK